MLKITPCYKTPRQTWSKAFQVMQINQDDALLDPALTPLPWDEEE